MNIFNNDKSTTHTASSTINTSPIEIKKVGRKDDKDKNRLDLIDVSFIESLGKVLTYGANKYEANNWQKVEDPVNRYYAATLRHLFAWRNGEVCDPESGLPHLAHIATNIMFLQHFEKEDK